MSSPTKPLNPRTTHYEFCGPIGTAVMRVGLVLVVLALYAYCNGDSCSLDASSLSLDRLPSLWSMWHPLVFPIILAWLVFHALMYLSPLGFVAMGTKLRDGSQLKYKINGIHAFILSHILFAVAYFGFNAPVSFVYKHYLSFAVSVMVLSVVLSMYLYLRSHRPNALLALGGNSGNALYDSFMGRELNPRVGVFDLKVFCELRPGLIGWVIINYCMMVAQYEKHGHVTVSMILVCVFHAWYILDALWFEEAILTTMDITHDGFGFMLAFGDLAWVPFTYTLQARYLVDYPTELSPLAIVGIVLLNMVGYAFFRGANSQKDVFRRNPAHPSVSHLKTISTQRGTRLIVSGWWGVCRHPNYVGDLMMGLAWCLPCGLTHVIPYFYIVFFTILLIHRQLRDEGHCRDKYGKDWDRFCGIVRWRLIPGIY